MFEVAKGCAYALYLPCYRMRGAAGSTAVEVRNVEYAPYGAHT